MTPQFAGIIVPGVDFSQPEPQKYAFLQTLTFLRKNGAFPAKECFLEVVPNFKYLQTFNTLEVLGAERPKRLVKRYICTVRFGFGEPDSSRLER
jgi:hypothetical protein